MGTIYKFDDDFFTEEEIDHKNLLCYEGDQVNNLAHGYGKLTFSNKVIKYDGFFKNGLIDGYGKMYNNGKIVSEGYYHKGEEVATVKLYDEDGVLEIESIDSTINFDGDYFFGKLYYNSGKVKYFGKIKFGSKITGNEFVFNGKGKYYYENGQLRCEGNFIESQLVGYCEIFYENGSLKERGNYKRYYTQDVMELLSNEEMVALLGGYGETFYDNGNLCVKGYFEEGLINGECEEYYHNGNLKYKGSKIIKGQYDIDGEYILLSKKSVYNGYGILKSENGILQYEGEFREGLKKGKGKLYDSDGSLVKEGVFDEFTEDYDVMLLKRKINSLTINNKFKDIIDENSVEKIDKIIIDKLTGEGVFLAIKNFDDSYAKYLKQKFNNINNQAEEIKKLGSVIKFLETAEYHWFSIKKGTNIFVESVDLDKTYLVEEYFKAIELYMCEKIGRSCSGSIIGNKQITIDSFSYYTQTTLGDYKNYIKDFKSDHADNCDPLISGKLNQRYKFVNALEGWIKNCRNALDHKDTLKTIEKAEEIRDKSYELIVMIENILK